MTNPLRRRPSDSEQLLLDTAVQVHEDHGGHWPTYRWIERQLGRAGHDVDAVLAGLPTVEGAAGHDRATSRPWTAPWRSRNLAEVVTTLLAPNLVLQYLSSKCFAFSPNRSHALVGYDVPSALRIAPAPACP